MKSIFSTDKQYIKGMNLDQLQELTQKAGESKFRAEQLYEWMYRHGSLSFSEMKNINKPFRLYLNQNYVLNTLIFEKKLPSKIDLSNKILFKTLDGKFIETVSMIEGNRHTVCISSQVGCALDCSFCATGSLGLERNLNSGEIIDQLIYIRNNIKKPITNIVFMGMGEPFHNYNNVLNAADILHAPKGFNLAASRITISTVGMLPQIKKFINEKRKYKLAISLNASNDNVRSKIMPINKKWKISDLIEISKKYSNQKKRFVMFEYVLLKGINDSKTHAVELSNLLKGIPCKINLIPYNETDGIYRRSDLDVINQFSDILHEKRDGYRVLVRWSKGQDIDAGCGQLAGKNI